MLRLQLLANLITVGLFLFIGYLKIMARPHGLLFEITTDLLLVLILLGIGRTVIVLLVGWPIYLISRILSLLNLKITQK